jgi:hypothetical protein
MHVYYIIVSGGNIVLHCTTTSIVYIYIYIYIALAFIVGPQ